MLRNKWVYKVKFNSKCEIEKYKTKLVAKYFGQKYGVDHKETFDLVENMFIVRIILALSATQGWKIFQLDVKSVFLNGNLDVEIYMSQLEGFVILGKE